MTAPGHDHTSMTTNSKAFLQFEMSTGARDVEFDIQAFSRGRPSLPRNPQFGYDFQQDDPTLREQQNIEEDYDFFDSHSAGEVEPNASPSYHFPGTWDAAYHKSSEAAKEIGKATKQYVSGVATSGIGQASVAVGHATLVSTGKLARLAANRALAHAPNIRQKLPSFARGWLREPAQQAATAEKRDELPLTATQHVDDDSFTIIDSDAEITETEPSIPRTAPPADAIVSSPYTDVFGRMFFDDDDDEENEDAAPLMQDLFGE